MVHLSDVPAGRRRILLTHPSAVLLAVARSNVTAEAAATQDPSEG